jgi:hypothetical protein
MIIVQFFTASAFFPSAFTSIFTTFYILTSFSTITTPSTFSITLISTTVLLARAQNPMFYFDSQESRKRVPKRIIFIALFPL